MPSSSRCWTRKKVVSSQTDRTPLVGWQQRCQQSGIAPVLSESGLSTPLKQALSPSVGTAGWCTLCSAAVIQLPLVPSPCPHTHAHDSHKHTHYYAQLMRQLLAKFHTLLLLQGVITAVMTAVASTKQPPEASSCIAAALLATVGAGYQAPVVVSTTHMPAACFLQLCHSNPGLLLDTQSFQSPIQQVRAMFQPHLEHL